MLSNTDIQLIIQRLDKIDERILRFEESVDNRFTTLIKYIDMRFDIVLERIDDIQQTLNSTVKRTDRLEKFALSIDYKQVKE